MASSSLFGQLAVLHGPRLVTRVASAVTSVPRFRCTTVPTIAATGSARRGRASRKRRVSPVFPERMAMRAPSAARIAG
jgi:hypothetical protein